MWQEHEILILIEFYPIYGSRFCAEKLNRSIVSVRKKAKKLNLPKPKEKLLNLKYTKESLEKLCKENKSVGEILDRLNLRRAGGNYKSIKNYLEKYNINTNHFIEAKEYLKLRKKFELKDILVIESKFNRTQLKKRLYDENILKRECCLCGQDENWNGMKISLILDHINGVYNDNRLENLRIVCPNCNAGLDTFAGRNTKREKTEYHCKCGNKKSRISNLCNNCHAESRRKVDRPSIEQLLKEVEEVGYCAVGRKYGVSDNTIRKWIKSEQKKTN